MYAQPARTQSGSRPASLGAALAINGALIAGIISAAPEIVPPEITTLIGRNIPLPQPTPEITPAPLPTAALPLPQPRTLPKPQPPERPDTSTNRGPDTGTTATGGAGIIIDQPPEPPPPLPQPSATPAPVMVGAAPDPRFADRMQPSYPPSEMRMGTEGEVSLRVLIGTDGRVKAAEKIAATSDAFWEATKRQALGRWRFRPATRDGVPVESWFATRVRFVIE